MELQGPQQEKRLANKNKAKGRAAERDAQAYLEYIGWEVLDCHANDAMEGLTNADLLAFPDGVASKVALDVIKSGIGSMANVLIEQGLEVQVKYSSAQSYGTTSIYNRHEREGIDLGSYRSGGPGADFGTYQSIRWVRHDDDGPYYSGSINAMRQQLDGGGLFDVEADYRLSGIVRGFADGCDILMAREPHKPWLVVWRGTIG